MDIATAQTLCLSLRRTTLYKDTKLVANIVEVGTENVIITIDGKLTWQRRTNARIVFSGAKSGEHSLDVYASDEARVLAHWAGYCENNGLHKPQVGQIVAFPSGSAHHWGGFRQGRVIKLGPKRAVIAYRFKNGHKTTITLPFSELRFDAFAKVRS